MHEEYYALIERICSFSNKLDASRLPIEGRTFLVTHWERKILLQHGCGDNVYGMQIVTDPEKHRDSNYLLKSLEAFESLL